MSLNDLGLKYDTDKASLGHNYLHVYEKFLPGSGVFKLLEIGVYKGGSLRMWRDYYPDCQVTGIDNQSSCMIEEERINTILLGVKDIDSLDVSGFDVVIDDGSHKWFDQLNTFFSIFPRLKPGAFYILEDLHSSNYSSFQDITITPLYIFKNIDIFKMIHSFQLFEVSDGIEGVSLMMRKNAGI